MDFTFNKYEFLLKRLIDHKYYFVRFDEFLNSEYLDKTVILRHDVEKHYEQALQFASIQNKLNIKGTYFFRLLPGHFSSEIVKEIANLGHEIGYHYDDLAQCIGDYEKAIIRFQKNLSTLRDIAPVKTICMDGSPWSKFDNKDLWRRGKGVKGREGDSVRKKNRTVAQSHSRITKIST